MQPRNYAALSTTGCPQLTWPGGSLQPLWFPVAVEVHEGLHILYSHGEPLSSTAVLATRKPFSTAALVNGNERGNEDGKDSSSAVDFGRGKL